MEKHNLCSNWQFAIGFYGQMLYFLSIGLILVSLATKLMQYDHLSM